MIFNERFDDIKPGDIILPGDPLFESIDKTQYTSVFIILTKGNSVVSRGIEFFTKSDYTHASISFEPKLKTILSYNMHEGSGLVHETLQTFKDNTITVFTFFTHNKFIERFRKTIEDFETHRTSFDIRIFICKVFNIEKRPTQDKYHQVCSTFVSYVLDTAGIRLDNGKVLPAPSDIYEKCKDNPNTIFEVYTGPASKYNPKSVISKLQYIIKREDTKEIDTVEETGLIEYNDELY